MLLLPLRGVLLAGAGEDDAAALQLDDAVGQALHLREVVGDPDDGDAVVGELADEALEDRGRGAIEGGRRFVREDRLGAGGQGTGQAQALGLATSLVFLVPHLALLLVDVRMWPVIPVQFAAGWMLGWLRHRTGSFVPGAAVHTIANIAAGLIAA